MRKGFYMHKDSMDICIEVVKIQYSNQRKVVLKARWWNLGYMGEPYFIYHNPQTLTILQKDLHKWVSINSKIYNKRTKPGLPT